MNRQDKIRRVLDTMCDGHREIVAELEKFNENENRAQALRDEGCSGPATTRARLSISCLAKATALMEVQSTRLKNLIWEIECAV